MIGLGVRDVERDPSRAAVFALVNAWCASTIIFCFLCKQNHTFYDYRHHDAQFSAASESVWPRSVALGGVSLLVGMLSSGNLQVL